VIRFPRRIALLLGLLLLSLAGCSSSGSSSAKSTAAPSSSSASAAASASGTAAQIVISNFAFHPAALTVTPGEKVTVTNRDSTAHTVTDTAADGFNTGDVDPGATVTFTAPAKAGTYPYICTIHQFMHGTLTVS
jgi:plastocyanin